MRFVNSRGNVEVLTYHHMRYYIIFSGETHSYFIGLERTGEGPHEFQWEDGTSADGGQTFWAKGEPSNSSNDYVILEKTGKSGSKMKWRNVGNVKAQFICERERGRELAILFGLGNVPRG